MTCDASAAHCLAVWLQDQGFLGEAVIAVAGAIVLVVGLSLVLERWDP